MGETKTSGDRPMTATEARELKNLVTGEFKVLRDEVNRRAKRLHRAASEKLQQAREEANESRSEALEAHYPARAALDDEYRKALDVLNARFAKKADVLVGRLRRDGIVLDERYIRGRTTWDQTFYTGDSYRGYTDWSEWKLAESSEVTAARQAVKDLEQQTHEARYSIDRREQDMLRDLVLTQLTSKSAVEFFEAIPSAEQLLPAPETLAALNGG
jgi:hypothetical protein